MSRSESARLLNRNAVILALEYLSVDGRLTAGSGGVALVGVSLAQVAVAARRSVKVASNTLDELERDRLIFRMGRERDYCREGSAPIIVLMDRPGARSFIFEWLKEKTAGRRLAAPSALASAPSSGKLGFVDPAEMAAVAESTQDPILLRDLAEKAAAMAAGPGGTMRGSSTIRRRSPRTTPIN